MSTKTNNYGIVYVLTNPAMPDIVKIDMTNRDTIDARMKELFNTSIPLPFECEYACKVSDCEKVEKALHIAFHPYRIHAQREFFKIYPEQAIAILSLNQPAIGTMVRGIYQIFIMRRMDIRCKLATLSHSSKVGNQVSTLPALTEKGLINEIERNNLFADEIIN